MGSLAAAKRSKTLVVAQAGDVSSVDEHQLAGVAKNALIQIYDWQWVRYRSMTLPNGTLMVNAQEMGPGIIASWKTEPQANGTAVHRFHIRKGAVHHSGNSVTAEDFKYAILRNVALGRDTSERNLGGMYGADEGLTDSVRIIDSLTFEIRTKKNLSMFIDVFAMRTYFDSKLAKQHATKEDPWSKALIGKNDVDFGPYVIERWKVGTEMRLKRFKDYWGPPAPFYGIRKIRGELRDRGYQVGRGHVRTLMQKMDIHVLYQKPRLSEPHPGHKAYPYLLRGLEINRANHVWVTDICYLPMARGFCYLVAIMDWARRRVLAWRLSNTLDLSFFTDSLEEALENYGTPEIFNTDQGSQFTSEAFTGILAARGIRISMDGKGRWMDNTFIERLWKSVKYEEVYLKA